MQTAIVGGLLPVVTESANGVCAKEDYRLRLRQTDATGTLSGYYKLAEIVLNEFYSGLIQTVGSNCTLIHVSIANHTSNNFSRAKIISGSNDNSISFYYSGTLGSGSITLYAKVTNPYKNISHLPLLLRYNQVNALKLEDIGNFTESSLTKISIS